MNAEQINELTMREFVGEGVSSWWETTKDRTMPMVEAYTMPSNDPVLVHTAFVPGDEKDFTADDLPQIAEYLSNQGKPLRGLSLISFRRGHVIVGSVAIVGATRFVRIINVKDGFREDTAIKGSPETLPLLECLARQCAEVFLLQWSPDEDLYNA